MYQHDDGDTQETTPVCTANVGEGESPPNPLFTPPCACPRCAPTTSYEVRRDDGWLRISGDQHRYRVEPVELGALGRDVLG